MLKTIPAFEAQMSRLHEATNTSTQRELAAALGISMTAISAAKKRETLPTGWIVTLATGYNINPRWIISGDGGRYIIGADSTDGYDIHTLITMLRDKLPDGAKITVSHDGQSSISHSKKS